MTFNRNGINNHRKLKDVFYYLRQQKADIIFLQETHLKFEAERFITSGWGFDCFLLGVNTNKNGVAILFNNTFKCYFFNTVRDPNGWVLRLLNKTNKQIKRMTLVNAPGPSNADKPDFFDTLS